MNYFSVCEPIIMMDAFIMYELSTLLMYLIVYELSTIFN